MVKPSSGALKLKQTDGLVDGVILAMPDTRQTRAFRREFEPELRELFPIPDPLALRRLAAGSSPGGCALVIL
jgi:hypothetical protein